MPQLTSKRGSILISGASTGIGLCCAKMLAEQGFRVFAGYRNEADAVRLRTHHPNIVPIPLEVTNEASIAAALAQVEAELAGAERAESAQGGHGLVGLINNAGIVVGGPLEFIPVSHPTGSERDRRGGAHSGVFALAAPGTGPGGQHGLRGRV